MDAFSGGELLLKLIEKDNQWDWARSHDKDVLVARKNALDLFVEKHGFLSTALVMDYEALIAVHGEDRYGYNVE